MTASLTGATSRAAVRLASGRPRRSAARRGFTLVEALIASVLLALGVSGVATAMTASIASTRAVRQQLTGTGLARERIEELLARPIDAAAAAAAGGSAASLALVSDYANAVETVETDPADAGQSFTRTTTISPLSRPVAATLMPSGAGTLARPVAVTPANDLVIATVVVKKPDGSTVTLARLITRSERK